VKHNIYKFGLVILLLTLNACTKQIENQNYSAVNLSNSDACYVDAMILMQHPGPKAQMLRKNDERIFFCDTKEFFIELLAPEVAGQTLASFVQDAGGRAWGSYSDAWIEAKKAYYVFDSNQLGAMGPTIVPFSQIDAANAFIQKHHGEVKKYSEITIETIEAYIKKTANRFREAPHMEHMH